MKKIIAATLLLCSAAITTTYAQTEKGTQMLGLEVSVLDSKSNYTSQTQSTKSNVTIIDVLPSYSYFIADKLDLGLSVGYTHRADDQEYAFNAGGSSAYKNNQNGYSAALTLRKYLMFNNKVGVRTGPYLYYSKTTGKFTNAEVLDYNSSYKTYIGGAGLDFVYYPLKKLGLAARLATIQYQYSKTVSQYTETSKNFNARLTSNLGLTCYYIF